MSTETPAIEPEPKPARSTLIVPITNVEWRDSGDPERKHETTMRGIAAPFNSLSEDLGGFREIIEPLFFRSALRKKPDVRLLINHDGQTANGLPIARTASGTLELRENIEVGLETFARIDKRDPDVQRLRYKMERGDVDQMSFAFTLREGGDDWAVAEDGTVIRTLRADGADEIFDVSIVTYPAYRATHAEMRSVLQEAISRGRLPDLTVARAEELAAEPEVEAEGEAEVAPEGEGEEVPVAQEAAGESDDQRRQERIQRHRDELLRLLGEINEQAGSGI